MLSPFDLTPIRRVLGLRQIRDRPIVTAGRAELLAAIDGNEPVAAAVPRIATIAVGAVAGVCQRQQALLARSLERRHGFLGWQVAKLKPAAFAAGILKIEWLPAVLALKQLHRVTPALPHAPRPRALRQRNCSAANASR